MLRTVAVFEAARALTERGLANVSAFAEALGHVRFFHPSSESLHVNWDAFAVRGIRAIERATTPDELASSLRALFAPVAPTVKFVRTGTPIPALEIPPNATHAIFWRHFGVGMPSGGASQARARSVYRSERVVAPLADVGKPTASPLGYRTLVSQARMPDPAQPIAVVLEGGVTMSVPIALFTTESTVDESAKTSSAAPVDEHFVAGDRATRLAAVALAWTLFEHFYPYFDVVQTDWPAARTAAFRSAATDPDANAFDATLDRLIAALRDGHGHASRSGRARALPDIRLRWVEGHVIVTSVGDSASANGVQRGDEITCVDGRPVADVLADKSSRISGATAHWVRSRAVWELLAGDTGTPVQLQLRGPDGATREAQVTRNARMTPSAPTTERIAEVWPGTMYVDLGRITDADFNEAMPKLEAARAIIFDMRGYPRTVNTAKILAHLTDSVIHSAHFQTPVITMPKFRDVGYVDGAWTITPVAPRLRARIVFLSGASAISYAESTLGVVEAYRLGDIVGEASAGTNGNVNPFFLPGGYRVTWTGMLVKKRDGTPHHGVGIVPTVPVSPTVAGVRAGRDEVLERAIDLVKT
jgi:hypothetical protein